MDGMTNPASYSWMNLFPIERSLMVTLGHLAKAAVERKTIVIAKLPFVGENLITE